MFVLLHGFAQTPATWKPVADKLRASGYSVEAADLYAMLPECGTLDGLCDRVARLVASCGRSAPVVLVGYSMGGRMAAQALVRHPDLPVAAAVLESAGLGPQDDAERAALAARSAQWAARLRSEGVGPFMDWWETLPLFASQQALPASVRQAVRRERVDFDAEALARSLEGWGQQHQSLQAETLAALERAQDAGVLLAYVTGSLDKKYCALADCVRDAGLPTIAIPDAGHNVHLEKPDRFADLLVRAASEAGTK